MPGLVLVTGDTALIKKLCHHTAYSSGKTRQIKYIVLQLVIHAMTQNEPVKGDGNGGGGKEGCCVKWGI